MTDRIPLYRSYSTQADIDAVSAVIRRGTYWAEGPEIAAFEQGLINYVGIPGAVACNSGTSALHMAMIACGIKRGDQVIVPSFTFQSTANAALFVRAMPVFADIEERTYGLDPADVEQRITKKTKAIIAVHYAGCACQIAALYRVARDHRLTLIEDAAEGMGSKVGDRHVGTWGTASVLSFCANKVISTGEGGAVLTDEKRIHDRLLELRSHGRVSDNRYVSLGFNFRLPSVLAALGLSQLGNIAEVIKRRQRIARWYDMALKGIPGIRTFDIPTGQNHVYQLYTIRVENGQRDSLMQRLAEKGIQSKVYFPGIHQSDYYHSLGYKDHLPVTERVEGEVLSLPMFPTLTIQEVGYIAETIRGAM
jgi:perosamine synthetase